MEIGTAHLVEIGRHLLGRTEIREAAPLLLAARWGRIAVWITHRSATRPQPSAAARATSGASIAFFSLIPSYIECRIA